MRIQYASDLHLEFKENAHFINQLGLEPTGEVLLLAGDIIYLENRRMEAQSFFDWCSGHFRQTIIVPGNHEYYRDPYAKGYEKPYKNLAETLDRYDHAIRENVSYINNKSIIIDDVEIFGTTLWTITDPRNYVGIQTSMNDCHQITYGDHKLWADDYTEVHNRCCTWLDEAILRSTTRQKIVLTHHCPISRKEFDKPTTVLCNQLGYVQCGEQEAFNRSACFEV